MTAASGSKGHSPSEQLSQALLAAAPQLERLDLEGRKVRERDLADALGADIPGSEVERRVPIPGWDPQPGNVDLFGRGEDGNVSWAAEVKLKSSNDLYECIWDMAKMASLATTPGVEEVFIVAGTTERMWEKPFEAAALFEKGSHDLVAEIERLGPWWVKYILGDSRGRPKAVPPRIRSEPAASADLLLGGAPWRVVVLRVSAEPEGSGCLDSLRGGNPEAVSIKRELSGVGGDDDSIAPHRHRLPPQWLTST